MSKLFNSQCPQRSHSKIIGLFYNTPVSNLLYSVSVYLYALAGALMLIFGFVLLGISIGATFINSSLEFEFYSLAVGFVVAGISFLAYFASEKYREKQFSRLETKLDSDKKELLDAIKNLREKDSHKESEGKESS